MFSHFELTHDHFLLRRVLKISPTVAINAVNYSFLSHLVGFVESWWCLMVNDRLNFASFLFSPLYLAVFLFQGRLAGCWLFVQGEVCLLKKALQWRRLIYIWINEWHLVESRFNHIPICLIRYGCFSTTNTILVTTLFINSANKIIPKFSSSICICSKIILVQYIMVTVKFLSKRSSNLLYFPSY